MKLNFISRPETQCYNKNTYYRGDYIMENKNYKIVVSRVFSDNGKSLEEIYIEYMASKIAEVIKEINKESVVENVCVSEFAY